MQTHCNKNLRSLSGNRTKVEFSTHLELLVAILRARTIVFRSVFVLFIVLVLGVRRVCGATVAWM